MFQTAADFTPIVIGLVGIGQVGVLAWGIAVMRDAGRERSEQMAVLLDSVRESTNALREVLEGVSESSKGIRELLARGQSDGRE